MDPSSTAVSSRRTRNRAERRDRVYAAAIELFVACGYDATSMEDIADRAGVARTTVFNHFPRKGEFLVEWSLRRRTAAAGSSGVPASDGRPVRELMGGYLAALAALNDAHRDEMRALLPPSVREQIMAGSHPLAEELAEILITSGARTRPSADPYRVGRLLALGYFGVMVRWIAVEPAPFDLADDLAALLDTVLDGALED